VIKTIKHLLRNLVLGILHKFNLVIARNDSYLNHKNRSEEFFLKTRDGYDFVFFQKLLEKKSSSVLEALKLIGESKAQLRQDLLVLWLLNFKRDGIFIEFGATDGIDLSNTYLLEKRFGWTGVLAEPARIWHRDLLQNRSAKIDFRAVSKEDNNNVRFFESVDARFSTYSIRENLTYSENYEVETVKLESLIEENSLPAVIDYLSIDTEGTEFEILELFNFEKYVFRVITVEYSEKISREKVINLLSSYGYKRVFEDISQFEDWFIHPNYVQF